MHVLSPPRLAAVADPRRDGGRRRSQGLRNHGPHHPVHVHHRGSHGAGALEVSAHLFGSGGVQQFGGTLSRVYPNSGSRDGRLAV